MTAKARKTPSKTRKTAAKAPRSPARGDAAPTPAAALPAPSAAPGGAVVELSVRSRGWSLSARWEARRPVLGVAVAEIAAHIGPAAAARLAEALPAREDWLPRDRVMEALVLAGGVEAARAAREVEGALVEGEAAVATWLRDIGEGAALAVAATGDGDVAEKARILAALRETAGNKIAAAKLVGMPRRTFYRRLSAYGL